MLESDPRDPGSFRDPSGFVYTHEGDIYRQVNRSFEDDYRALLDSGLYAKAVAAGLLIEHEEASLRLAVSREAACVLRPRRIPFVSYPYEWAFSALKDAALLTLDLQRMALEHGMTLKDASAYNVLLDCSRPVFIDTLSLERYRDGSPWAAYSQFCRHFLAPLALMSHRDLRLGQMLRSYLDGIPLDLASSLLSPRIWARPGLLIHMGLHGRLQQKHSRGTSIDASVPTERKVSLRGLQGIIASLRRSVAGLTPRKRETHWTAYYEANSYEVQTFQAKEMMVSRYLDRIAPDSLWDLGSNTGHFSEVASGKGISTLAIDDDAACIERIYAHGRAKRSTVLPLVVDLANPSPASGWANRERRSLSERGPADAVLALALIHHLVIGNNTPLESVAKFLKDLCRHLIIEFVPKTDVQVRRMLSTRPDIFHDYTMERFEAVFEGHFRVLDRQALSGNSSGRMLYLMRRT